MITTPPERGKKREETNSKVIQKKKKIPIKDLNLAKLISTTVCAHNCVFTCRNTLSHNADYQLENKAKTVKKNGNIIKFVKACVMHF